MVLSAIVELRLDGNNIRVIPPGICRLKRLQELSMVRSEPVVCARDASQTR